MDSRQSRPRRPRADARRNYERLLAEAEAAFRAQGTDAPLDGIARQAGVAIGTLYGHFPTRRALVAAVLRDRNAAVLQRGSALLAEPSELAALTGWVRAVTRHSAAYQGLALLLADGAGDERSELHESCVHLAGLTEKLTARARDAGAVRPGVTGADVSALISAAAWTAERTSLAEADRFIDLAFGGLGQPLATDGRG